MSELTGKVGHKVLDSPDHFIEVCTLWPLFPFLGYEITSAMGSQVALLFLGGKCGFSEALAGPGLEVQNPRLLVIQTAK